jgi:hypothetical protein
VARDVLVPVLFRHPFPEQAFVARVPLDHLVEIQARDRVTEELCGFPGGTDRSAVPAVFQDVSFQLQLVYNLFEVGWHGLLTSFRIPGGEAPSVPSPAHLIWSNFVANGNTLT